MKNVTITLDEDVARWARIKAAEQDTSVSRMIGDMLRQCMSEDDDYHAAFQQFLSVSPVALRERGEGMPKREELYDRPVLRGHQRGRVRKGQ